MSGVGRLLLLLLWWESWVLIYLQVLSSKPENPGIPDRPECDDGWFVTYGYILSIIVDVVAAAVIADAVDVIIGVSFELLFADELFWSLSLWLLSLYELLLLLNDAVLLAFECSISRNGWNCVYFSSMPKNRSNCLFWCWIFLYFKQSIDMNALKHLFCRRYFLSDFLFLSIRMPFFLTDDSHLTLVWINLHCHLNLGRERNIRSIEAFHWMPYNSLLWACMSQFTPKLSLETIKNVSASIQVWCHSYS